MMDGAEARLVEGSDWGFFDKYGKKFADIPARIKDVDVLGIMELAKKVEAEAYSRGKRDGLLQAAQADKRREEVNNLRAANARLTSKLEQLIIEAE